MTDRVRGLPLVAIAAIVAGVLTGVAGGTFRLLLSAADRWREQLAGWAHSVGWAGVLVPIVVSAVAAAVAGWITDRVPLAGGSGIQHVEAVERGEADPTPPMVLPARFVGALLAIGAGGLVLGREGPTVHMGAAIGQAVGVRFRLAREDLRALHAQLAGAGLAVAFNAPIAGALFVLEEITHRVRSRDLIPLLLSVGTAIVSMRLVLGNEPDFAVGKVSVPSTVQLVGFVLLGGILGLIGTGYSWLIMALLRLADRLSTMPTPGRAGAIGAMVGALVFADPNLVGGGDVLTQMLLTGRALAIPAIGMYLVVRFVLGPLSYAAGTPGGLFAPMLAIGALGGVLVHAAAVAVFPATWVPASAVTYALVGMSTLFAASVRAPLTGIVLVTEMTATTSAMVPAILAAAVAMAVAIALRSVPIYDSLRVRMLSRSGVMG